MATRFALLCALCALISLAACQIPGPDWPECASLSSRHHRGWEVIHLTYQSTGPLDRPSKAQLELDVQNVADGSRTVCTLSRDGASQPGGGSRATLYLDNSDGKCETGWAEKYDSFSDGTPKGPVAQIKFDTITRELSISQTWTCRGENKQLYVLARPPEHVPALTNAEPPA
jgi:hypothetical protein